MSKSKFLSEYDVCVVFGGISSENEVSVITGTMACNLLKKAERSVLPVYVDHAGNFYAGDSLADVTLYKDGGYKNANPCGWVTGGAVIFKPNGKKLCSVKLKCMLNCCHGGAGEGGAIAGLSQIIGVPFASAGLFESAAFMDKYYTKLILKSLGVKVAKYAYFRDIQGATEGAGAVGYPVIIKPATLGSSIGISKAENKEELEEGLKLAFELDEAVIIEQYFADRKEINCAAYYLDGEVVVSPLEEVSSAGDILSYDDKYSGGGKREFPAQLNVKTDAAIKEKTQLVYSKLGMRGVVRFDYIVSGGQVYLSEVNTVPGSLSQYLLSKNFKEFGKVLCKLINQAQTDYSARAGKKVISTGILNNVRSNTCKTCLK